MHGLALWAHLDLEMRASNTLKIKGPVEMVMIQTVFIRACTQSSVHYMY